MSARRYFFNAVLGKSESWQSGGELDPSDVERANLIGSITDEGTHVPVLDIDFPVRLEPSSTPGHFHLYLDGIELDWSTYKMLLAALAAAGVIEEGYRTASLSRGMTLVRKPGVTK